MEQLKNNIENRYEETNNYYNGEDSFLIKRSSSLENLHNNSSSNIEDDKTPDDKE
jgi:hypothetical protein